MKTRIALALAILPGWFLAAQNPPAAARARAYQLSVEGRLEEAAAQFQTYVQQHPEDTASALDFASLLSKLGRHQDAAALLEKIHKDHPGHETVYFRLGIEYIALERPADATPVFTALSQSSNQAIAAAAAQSLKELRAVTQSEARLQAETRVFTLAREGRHAEVLKAIEDIEARWGLNDALEMQRLYALYDLGRYEEGLYSAEILASRNPRAAGLALLRAEMLVKLKRPDEARALWRRIERDYPGSLSGLEAQRRLQAMATLPPQPPSEEDRYFDLARQDKHREVIESIDAMEQRTGQVSWMMELQRLYSLLAAGQIERAQQRADVLAPTHPDSPELGFIRAEILIKQNRSKEAVALWERIAQTHVGTPVEAEARRRLAAFAQPPQPPSDEDRIYALARNGRHEEVVRAIDELEVRAGPLSQGMQLQRLYALQALGQKARALALADQMNASLGPSPDLALARADLLVQNGQTTEAAAVLSGVIHDYPADPAADKARARLEVLPPIYNLEKGYWGEAYFSGDYLGRYGDLIGSGLARHGVFVPGARWLQPYAEFRFSVDTDSGGSGARQTIVSDNFVGFFGGVRAQVLASEYLFVYGQAGASEDLLDNREDGDWAYDYQGGAYGFKSWGPGTVLQSSAPYDQRFEFVHTGRDASTRVEVVSTNGFFWRNDWFVDAGADFSYYHRYSSWLGYGQAHQGLRVFQIGPTLAFDSYLVEYLAWDVKGNYFDNFVSYGPGLRWLWQPCRAAQIVLHGEYVFGNYFGRDGEDNRGGASGDFNGVQVGLSVGLRW